MQEQFVVNIHHPILKNHRVYGRCLLPGLAYVDLLYQIFREHGYDYSNLELRNLTIYHPLFVDDDYDVTLNIQCVETSCGQWQIQVEGSEKRDKIVMPDKVLYITAQMQRRSVTFCEEILDLNLLQASSSTVMDITGAYERCRSMKLVHSGFMKVEGLLYDLSTALVADLSVGQTNDFNVEGFMFHPALIDGSGIAAGTLLVSQIETAVQHLFLPMYFQSFYATELFTKQCITRIPAISMRQEKELVYLNMEFFNKTGRKVGELKNFVGKLVRDSGFLNFLRNDGPTVMPNPASKPSAAFTKTSDRGSDQADLRGEIILFLRQLLADRLKQPIELIDSAAGYYEMGLDSPRLLEIVHQIESQINAVLSPTLLFEYTTIDELAAYLDENYATKFGSLRAQTLEKQPNRAEPVQVAVDNFHPGCIPLKANTYVFSGAEAFLQDHLVFDKPALMGITHPCLVLETYLQNNPESLPVQLSNIKFIGGPVTLKKTETVQISIEFEKVDERTKFQTAFYLTNPHNSKSCCQGECSKVKRITPEKIAIGTMLEQSKTLDNQAIQGLYRSIKDFKLGPMLKTIDAAFVYNDTTLISKVSLAGKLMKGNMSQFVLDPLLLNSCYYIYQEHNTAPKTNIFIPLMIESLTVYRPMTEKAYVLVKTRLSKDDFISFDAQIVTEDGEFIAEILNASLKEVVNPSLLSNASFDGMTLQAKALSGKRFKVNEKKSSALDIAIIGMAGRYPQAYDLEEFWRNLQNGQDCITEIPKERWNWQDYYTEDRTKPGHIYSKWGGFIADVDRFDPKFFNISPREAVKLDPQERLFLEHCWKALEDAGYTRARLRELDDECLLGQVGVYVGVMAQEYVLFAAESNARGERLGLSAGIASIANRVSYFFDLHGPSIAIDTMCSSSLTSVYLACQALKENHINLALAGGVNVIIHPNKYLLLSQGQFISSKGHCESFGEGGDGYIPSEGVGVLVLKRLADAERDRDHIYGVIKGVAINHGGKASGFTVPNQKAQSQVIASALKFAKINPRTISYLEAHGTGTSLGDPIEISGLTKAFQEYTKDKQYCALGSAKSNIGHCESAASIAGITKVLLQLKHGQLVPSLHALRQNTNIDFSNTPFFVQQELAEWKRPVVVIDGDTREYPRIAGISSFGAGGSNAHVVIEEYISDGEKAEQRITAQRPAIIVLSAKSAERLREQVQQLLAALCNPQFSDSDLANIAYTLQVAREPMEERLALTVQTIQELREKFQGYLNGKELCHSIYLGQAKRTQETSDPMASVEELQAAIEAWKFTGQYDKLLNLWVIGRYCDWNMLYGEDKPRRISLPTYPFARERYWIVSNVAPQFDHEATSVIKAVPVQSALLQKAIQPKADTKTIAEKPNGVSLISLSNYPAFFDQAAEHIPEELPIISTALELKASNVSNSHAEGQISIGRDLLREELKVSLAEVLGMQQDEIDENALFVDMGLDSVTGVEWIRAINRQYVMTVQATKIYDYPSINEMAGYLAQELAPMEIINSETSMKSNVILSLSEILYQVKNGLIDSERAEKLFAEATCKSNVTVKDA